MAKPKSRKIKSRLSYAIDPKVCIEFIEKCKTLGKTPSEVLQDFTEGFVAGRIKLKYPPAMEKAIKEAYE